MDAAPQMEECEIAEERRGQRHAQAADDHRHDVLGQRFADAEETPGEGVEANGEKLQRLLAHLVEAEIQQRQGQRVVDPGDEECRGKAGTKQHRSRHHQRSLNAQGRRQTDEQPHSHAPGQGEFVQLQAAGAGQRAMDARMPAQPLPTRQPHPPHGARRRLPQPAAASASQRHTGTLVAISSPCPADRAADSPCSPDPPAPPSCPSCRWR